MIIGKAISPFALRKKINGGGGYDADAQAFITATGISGTNATATNKLVIDLKSANIWTKMKAVYPMVGGTSTTCKFNLKDARDLNAAYRLTFFGGGTFSSNGYLPNGINSFADTYLTASAALSLNSTHLSYYSRTNSNGVEIEIGDALSDGSVLEIRTSGVSYYRINSGASYISHADANSLGHYIANRTALNIINGWKNGAKTVSGVTPSTNLSNFSLTLCANDSGGSIQNISTKQCAFASIGNGLTDAEALAFYNAVQTFNTTLGRQV